MLETVAFIKEHENWRDLLSQAPYCLIIKEDNNYALLRYSQIESDFSEKIVRECRGLIIDIHTYEPVALSFYKFFNIQEPLADKIYWKDCRVQEKVDGSKILIWYNKYEDKWQISTSGVLNAYEANVSDFGATFGSLVDKAVINAGFKTKEEFTDLLDSNYCYTFELVSPESRVVIPYKDTKLYFIGLRRVSDLIECNPDSCKTVCKYFNRPKEYKLNSVKACMDATAKMGFDEEGFVIVDKFWQRIKVKSPAYVAASHVRENGSVNKSSILEIIERGEREEFLGYFPEYKEYFDDLEKKYNKVHKRIRQGIQDVSELIKQEKTQKELALFITANYKDISSILFTYIKADLVDIFINNQWSNITQDKKLNLLEMQED